MSRWIFKITEPGQAARDVEVRAGMTLGRDPKNDVAFSDTYVGVKHLKVVDDGGHLAIEDLGSTNHTRIGDSTVLMGGQRQTLASGLEFFLGKSKVRVLEAHGAPAVDAEADLTVRAPSKPAGLPQGRVAPPPAKTAPPRTPTAGSPAAGKIPAAPGGNPPPAGLPGGLADEGTRAQAPRPVAPVRPAVPAPVPAASSPAGSDDVTVRVGVRPGTAPSVEEETTLRVGGPGQKPLGGGPGAPIVSKVPGGAAPRPAGAAHDPAEVTVRAPGAGPRREPATAAAARGGAAEAAEGTIRKAPPSVKPPAPAAAGASAAVKSAPLPAKSGAAPAVRNEALERPPEPEGEDSPLTTRVVGEGDEEKLSEMMRRKPRLVLTGLGMRNVRELRKTEVLIGRDKGADVQLAHDSVSGRHARISFDGAAFVLEDLGSKNRTHLGDAPVEPGQTVELSGESALKFGRFDALFVCDEPHFARGGRPHAVQEGAAALLVKEGRVSRQELKQAAASAKEGDRHVGEMLLVQTQLRPQDWAAAVQRAQSGALPSSKLTLYLLVGVGLAVAAVLALLLVWLFK